MHISPGEVGDLKADEAESETEGLDVELVGLGGGGGVFVAVGEAELGFAFHHEGLHFLVGLGYFFAVFGANCLRFGGHAYSAVVGRFTTLRGGCEGHSGGEPPPS